MKIIETVAVLSLAWLGACSGEAPAAGPCCEAELAPSAVSQTSLYNLEAAWRDQTGKSCQLGDGAGAVRLIAMMFTNCSYACPRIVADLKAIESRLSPDAPVGFVLASFDTERDRPETLADYARKNRLGPDRWTLLHGDASAVRELSAALGVSYQKTAGGGFSHSNLIAVLDADGEIVHRQEGLGADPAPTIAAIRRSLSR